MSGNLGNSLTTWESMDTRESGEFAKFLRESEGSLFFKYR